MPKVSVVVPTYNNEQYLRECIDSILGQTLSDIEIIVVNDGSTDSTCDILSQYSNADSRIKVINLHNGGYGHAVNTGFDISEGEYIGIVESDDYIQSDMYEKLYYAAVKYDCDWIKADYQIFVGEEREREFSPRNICPENLYNQVLNPLNDREAFDAKLFTWAGIYKKSFLLDNHIRHHESRGAAYQDNGFWFQTMVSASRIMFINSFFYNLRRDNPSSSIMAKDKVFDIFKEYEFIYEKVYENGNKNKEFIDQFWYRQYKSYSVHLKRVSDEYRLVFLEQFNQRFCTAKSKNELSSKLFSRNEWNMLQMILSDYKAAYLWKFQEVKEMLDYIRDKDLKSVYIADEVGRRIFGQLFRGDKSFKINQIIIPDYTVLDKKRMLQIYHGYKVTLLNQVHDMEKQDALLLCAADAKWDDELSLLRDMNFSQIVPISQKYLIGNKILISVIITIFNKKEFLRECIESIINQTYRNLEIILVDDGSTDGSAEICDEYLDKDQRIKVIHKQNEGLVSARKSGIRIASGEYITYVDADDWLEESYYEKIYWRMVENDADVIAAGFIQEDEKESKKVKNSIETGYYEKEALLSEIYCKMLYYGGMFRFGILQYVWNKFYKRELLLKNQMLIDEDIVNGEDVACVYPCLLDAESIDVFNICQYHYRIYYTSMCRTSDDYLVDNAYKLYIYLKERFADSDYHKILQWQLSHYIVFLCQIGAKNAYGLGFKYMYPFDFGKIAYGQKVLLIAGGQRGESFYKQLKTAPICEVHAWIEIDLDVECREIKEDEWAMIDDTKPDIIVISSKKPEFYQIMRECFLERGFKENDIINVL